MGKPLGNAECRVLNAEVNAEVGTHENAEV
jgi:hypothetical protein